MLAYATHRRQGRHAHPAALALIVGAHAVALGLLITAKMDVGSPLEIVRTELRNIPLPADPPPPTPEQPKVQPAPTPPASQLDIPPVRITVPLNAGPTIEPLPTPPLPGPVIGRSLDPTPPPPTIPLPPPPARVTKLAQLATPADRLRPPYPESKRRLEEEAVLRLRLAIDDRGRVVSVDPVGAADPEFVGAARQHLTRQWRYKPATEDGRAVASTLVVSLRFELEE
ncbi:energy transducer TonB [Sphingomonas sp. GCM10030256]|uniref:energy transducer TonB n=1 Tax=Sphingomonas sp. GCM10030256 TaxID=3273427 RepID=UPI00361CAEBB